MEKKFAKKIITDLGVAKSKYEKAQEIAKNAISEYMFTQDFDIIYQPSDGFVVVDNDGNNVRLSSCLNTIVKKGQISDEDFYDLSI